MLSEKKPVSKGYMLHDSIHLKNSQSDKTRDRNRFVVARGQGWGGEQARKRRTSKSLPDGKIT